MKKKGRKKWEEKRKVSRRTYSLRELPNGEKWEEKGKKQRRRGEEERRREGEGEVAGA